MRCVARLALTADKDQWEHAISRLPPVDKDELEATIAEREARLIPLRRAEPRLDGPLSKSVAEAFAPMGAMMRPDMSTEQAETWATAFVKSYSDLPPYTVRSALDEALHIAFEFPAQMNVKVREIAMRKLGRQQRALQRLRDWQAKIHRIAEPKQAVIAAPDQSEPMPPDQIRALSAQFRRIGLSQGWLTQEQIDAADAQFPDDEQPQTMGETR